MSMYVPSTYGVTCSLLCTEILVHKYSSMLCSVFLRTVFACFRFWRSLKDLRKPYPNLSLNTCKLDSSLIACVCVCYVC